MSRLVANHRRTTGSIHETSSPKVTESTRRSETIVSKMKRRRTPTKVASECLGLMRPGHRRTLVDFQRIKSALEGGEAGWTSDESTVDKRDTRRRRVSDDDSISGMRSIEPGEIISDMESDEDMDISDSDFGAGQSSGPTTDTTPERSLSPSVSKAETPQTPKEESSKSRLPGVFSLEKIDTFQATQLDTLDLKGPSAREMDTVPSSQVKVSLPGPSSKPTEAARGLAIMTPEEPSSCSHMSEAKQVPVVQDDETNRERRPLTPVAPETMGQPSSSAVGKAKEPSVEDNEVDEGVEADIETEELTAGAGDSSDDSDDSDYHQDDSDDASLSDQEQELGLDAEAEAERDDDIGYLRLMPRSVLEGMLQRLLKPPQSQQTRRAVQSLIQENLPETLASYDTSLRIKINETHTAMMQEMQEEHSSLTSDDFAHVMARFLRNEVKVLHSFPGSGPATFELILYLAEHSFGDLELDDRPGFGERDTFDSAADKALLYVAEERLGEEGATFRAAIPGYLETIRSQAMYLYRHGRHPKTWFPATISFLQSSLQPSSVKKCGRLRSATRKAIPFGLQRVDMPMKTCCKPLSSFPYTTQSVLLSLL
ncbi:hypothetical protein BDY19DRAFT_921856 [Irpex rosettiformis]|uniref:Uncharacterized protein n=1 Tax=Irpex rosettiformis TaxID=378272 RepID=A0ACB8UHB0_9APHY|nr:hypothetical protein BDY19DRAFT_921856 [Irpex rosettiformis]